jgi:hypothetical protein
VGFECECGYRYMQKRPIAINTPTMKIHAETSINQKCR